MTQETTKAPPCCPVGARDDVGEVDATLRLTGSASVSLSAIAASRGIPKSSLHRHRTGCLGLTWGTSATTATRLERQAERGTQDHGTPVERRTERTGTSEPAKPTVAATAKAPRARALQQPVHASPSTVTPGAVALHEDPSAKVTAERIEAIANLIHFNSWRDRATVVGLSERWKIPHADVERLHRIAAAKVRSSRGSNVAQVEASIASTRKMRDDEQANAEFYDKATLEAFKAKDVSAAKLARKLATFSRQMWLAAQTHLDKITIIKPPSISVNVNVQASPDFEKAWDVVRRILDAKFPGASDCVDTGLSTWEDRGDEGLTEYLADDGAIVLAANADGSFG